MNSTFEKLPLVNGGKLGLVEHYTYFPKDINKICLLSKVNVGWFVLRKDEYEYLKDNLRADIQYSSQLPEKLRSYLPFLWKTNILTINGKTNCDLVSTDNSNAPELLVLKMTGSCNFKCSYCYDFNKDKLGTSINFKLSCDTIDFLLSKRNNLSISFHGGEPLLKFDIIKKIVEYVNYNWSKKKIKFSIQTNGSLINTEIISFLEKNNFTVGISLDGINKETNSFRDTGNHQYQVVDIFNSLVKKYPQFISDRCGVITVVRRGNIHEIPKFIVWLQDANIKSINFSFLEPVSKGKIWMDEIASVNDVVGLYEKLVEYIASKEIHSIYVKDIIMYIDNLLAFNKKRAHYCGALSTFLYLDSNNKYGVCDSLYDSLTLKTTTPDEGIIDDPVRDSVKNIIKEFENTFCSNCKFFCFCGGGCIVPALLDGKEKKPDAVKCEVTKYMYTKLLEEFSADEYSDRPIINYYTKFHNKLLP
jgi:uncharacterized protein